MAKAKTDDVYYDEDELVKELWLYPYFVTFINYFLAKLHTQYTSTQEVGISLLPWHQTHYNFQQENNYLYTLKCKILCCRLERMPRMAFNSSGLRLILQTLSPGTNLHCSSVPLKNT